MPSYNEKLQRIWHDFERETGFAPASPANTSETETFDISVKSRRPIPPPQGALVAAMPRSLTKWSYIFFGEDS